MSEDTARPVPAADASVYDQVKDYYGKTVHTSKDLVTNACTVGATHTEAIKEALKLIHPEIKEKNYGCGAVIPEGVEGCHVLDLGSGAGLDCYILSKMVGEGGYVVGVDMTKEQLDVARRHITYHTQKFGFSQPNVEFREGYIECLSNAGIADESFDFIVSNCVVNLSPNKTAVLKEAYRVLKPGGQLYFSDIYSNQQMPEALKQNKVLWGECLTGALQWSDMIQLATEIGFAPPILIKSVVFTNESDEVNRLLANVGAADLKFCSVTYRLVKSDWVHDLADDPLVDVEYNGSVKGHKKNIRFSYCGELLAGTRVAMPSSTAQLLTKLPLGVIIHGPSASTNSAYPSLSGFLSVNPFEVASGTMPVATPKGLSGSGAACCSGGSRSCC